MACSSKHKGEFIASVSSIQILEEQSEPGYVVLLVEEVEESDGQRVACDGCTDLDMPLCLQYCKESEKLMEILTEFIEKEVGKDHQRERR